MLRSQASDLGELPYDLLQAGRRLSFSLGDIFPNLSYPVVASLDRGDLDALYEAQQRHAPGRLGDNATKEFILRHVFQIAPELISKPSGLLRALLRRHYRGRAIPTLLDARFIQLLRQNSVFDDWPLATIVPDREAFFAFVQERWPIFLDRVAKDNHAAVGELAKPSYVLAIAGPLDLPFDHPDIRVYLDNLFLEGLLRPVSHQWADTLAKTWAAIGVRTDPFADRTRQIAKLLDSLPTAIPAEEAPHGDWIHFARRWAELTFLVNEQSEGIPESIDDRIKNLQAQVDHRFFAWIARRYAGLVNLPPAPPVMLHHLPRFLARRVTEDRAVKVATIVVDGLSLDQWLVVRAALASQSTAFRFREQAVFAWIPSHTSVSRQAAFAGKAPIFFPNSIHTTDREPALWAQFWADQGLMPRHEVVYFKGLGDGGLEELFEALSHPKARVAGLVVDKVDKIMHGMALVVCQPCFDDEDSSLYGSNSSGFIRHCNADVPLGSAGMHNQVRQWAQKPWLNALVDRLLERGFQVFLTSDHGNIEAQGCGRPAEGAVADLRGERVRVYPDPVLRRQVKARFPGALEWSPIGLPADYLPLLAPARQAFVEENQIIVSHGGVSVEELIVPLVQIERSA